MMRRAQSNTGGPFASRTGRVLLVPGAMTRSEGSLANLPREAAGLNKVSARLWEPFEDDHRGSYVTN